jgi:predicted dehydrogenase
MGRQPTGPIGVAVIGAGYWGPNLVRNLAASAEFELRWVCDLDADRARSALGPMSAVRVTTSLEDVLADPEVAAVAVATPAASHLEVAGAALAAGKHASSKATRLVLQRGAESGRRSRSARSHPDV